MPNEEPYYQSPEVVREAYERIKYYIHNTPIIVSSTLNTRLSTCNLQHKVFFKMDALQKTGAFKVRGVLNHLLSLQERGILPQKVVAYSTGNHGIGLAFAAKQLKIKARIYLPANTAQIKKQAAESYGAEVIYTSTRQEAEERTKNDSLNNDFYYLHPSDSDATIAGAGTICYEALQQLQYKPDAIFAACGGGGLLSGSYLAKELLAPNAMLIGCEPEKANDAFLSRKNNQIFRFTTSPQTIADGLRTLSLSERTFSYIKKLDGFISVKEEEIYYWTAWLMHLLKVVCEPSCSLVMQGVKTWLDEQTTSKNILVLISGGNIDPAIYRELWQVNYLEQK